MPDFVFDLPAIVTGPAIVLTLCAFALAGMLFVRRRVLPRLRVHTQDSEFSGALVQCVMTFFGLLLALVAVNVFQTHGDVSKVVSQEATALGVLYRDLECYPEPVRAGLQQDLRDYVDQVINEAWPELQRGRMPAGGVVRVDRFQERLHGFEPSNEVERIAHTEALHAYNAMLLARNMRLDAACAGLPYVMWIVILAGAAIALSSTFFFKVDDARLHGILATLLASFVGLVIFLIVCLDRPYRGDLGIGPESYQLVRDRLMTPALRPRLGAR